MPFPFEKLEIYRRALTFVGNIEQLCSELKGKVSYPILDQLTRAAISIPLNIAEGNGRKYTKEKLQFLRVARGSIFETVAIIQILQSRNHITSESYVSLYTNLETQIKMITNLAKFLDNNDLTTTINFMIDVESDGPIPGDYSMICLGAVIVEPELKRTFYGQLKPISGKWIPEALAVSGFSREETMKFDDPVQVMRKFGNWIKENAKDTPRFISDNNGYDWQFINWYFHHFVGENPFGHSSTNLGSLYKGLVKDTFVNFKHLRKTKHTHNPIDDAKGNAEALLAMKGEMGLKIQL